MVVKILVCIGMPRNILQKILILFFSLYISIYAENITVIPQKIEFNKQKAFLGKKLFKDKGLSIDNTISCESCHNLKEGGDDSIATSIGINGQVGNLNAPTVLNAVFNISQFWDGRARNLEEQAIEPIENPIEMGHSFDILIKKLKDTEYKKEFNKIYKDGISKKNIVNAIAEFEKTLITPNSRFDKFLSGQKDALTDFEKEGFYLFKNKGCISCHHGVNIGGNQYNKFGVIVEIDNKNLGRYNVTKNKEDEYYFKVPTLRNIVLTSPYFHDGRTSSLKEAVATMSMIQLGRPITEVELEKIVAFLETLTGELKIIE